MNFLISGLQSLKAAAELAQRKREQQTSAPMVHLPQNNNYTGTLKTVIKIQRPEKKGNGRMIYKASSSSCTALMGAEPVVSGDSEEPHSADASLTSKDVSD